MKPSPLEHVLGYRNEWVVHKLRERYAISLEESEDVFLETKRWLWLAAHWRARADTGSQLTVIGYPQLTIIDEMWHTFILFTLPYAQFCQEHFGAYLHHAPATRADHERVAAEKRDDPERFEQIASRCTQRGDRSSTPTPRRSDSKLSLIQRSGNSCEDR